MTATSLYIHIPWCEKKCPYCDFNSHTSAAPLPEQRYLNALLQDLETDLTHYGDICEINTIFIGGGTPSLMSAYFYQQLFQGIHELVTITHTAEITLEANPSSAEAQKFLEYRDIGINRLSLGIQSFNDQHLKTLGRIHDKQAAITAIQAATTAGFKRINLDLMFGLPDQTLNEALYDLQQAIDFGVDHLSWYQLTIEKNTLFYRQQPLLPSLDIKSDIQDAGHELLNNNHYEQYEISAFSQQSPCQHNLNYWNFGDYLGIGAGAHGKTTSLSNKKLSIIRSAKTRAPLDYLTTFNNDSSDRTHSRHPSIATSPENKIIPCSSTSRAGTKLQAIPENEYMIEFLMNALRLRSGFSLETAKAQANITLEALKAAIPQAFELNLLENKNGYISTTPHGWRFIDTILEMLV